MYRRLQITLSGENLKQRIQEAIRARELEMTILDDRIKAREGDQPFDVRADDGFRSFGELVTERSQLADRIIQLALLRDSVVVGDDYALSKADLRRAGIISFERPEHSCMERAWVASDSGMPVDGLKLTFSGSELRELLDERRRVHEKRAARWRHELTRGPEDQTDDAPLLPDQMCENTAEEEEWRAELAEFIRTHIDASEVYRLGQADLEFGDLLPDKPGSMKQAEWEERSGLAFSLERIARKL